MPDDSKALDDAIGLNAPEPAHMICHEMDGGRGLECAIVFAGSHRTSGGFRVIRVSPARREADRDKLKREVWHRFWRYLGAA